MDQILHESLKVEVMRHIFIDMSYSQSEQWATEIDDGRFDDMRENMFSAIQNKITATRAELLTYWEVIVGNAVRHAMRNNDSTERPSEEEVTLQVQRMVQSIDIHIRMIFVMRDAQ